MNNFAKLFVVIGSVTTLQIALPGGNKTMHESPFIIDLTVEQKQGLSAVLVNQSDNTQPYLHIAFLQRSEIVLTSDSNERLEPFDTRSVRKFDNTVHEYSFQELPPKESVLLGSTIISWNDENGYSITWGPFKFSGVPKGAYSAQVCWESGINKWYDDKTHSFVEVENIWLGKLCSNTVTLVLS